MPRRGWKEFACQGQVWYARRRYPSVPSSTAGFLPTNGADSGIEFITDRGERRFLKMTHPDVPTKKDLHKMSEAQLCELLAKAV